MQIFTFFLLNFQHETELVDCMMDQIHQMEENLQNLDHNDFRLVPHQMEVDRIRFIISSYLRTRLDKIEAFTAYLLKRDRETFNEEDRLMSPGEFEFAENFMKNLKEHCHKEAFKYMPTLLSDFGEGVRAMEVKPNLNSVVFVRMLKTVNDIIVSGDSRDTTVELPAGSRHLLPFRYVIDLIRDGSAVLI